MNYDETLQYLYRQMPEYQRVGHAAYKPGLENSHRLDAIFDQPHKKFKTIHVGGTNGKGSTSHLLAAILQQSGYKVGLYTSPHLMDFRERIRVNGEMVEQQFVIDFVEKYRTKFEPVRPSFFELTMEMAFLYFARQNVDVAVIEVGLGGRLDSTNIITPELSIITNIGFDHMQYLGDTLPKIALEKAGIIKPGIPVVIGEFNEETADVFKQRAAAVDAPIIFAGESVPHFMATHTDYGWHFSTNSYPHLIGQLDGNAQEKNAITVLAALEELKKLNYKIEPDAVSNGFAHVAELTGLMGRWQKVHKKPLIICDTAHNAHGMQYVVKQLSECAHKTLHIVFGMVNDKDIDDVLKIMPKDAIYYFTNASIERAVSAQDLQKSAVKWGLNGKVYEQGVKAAIEAAMKEAEAEDMVFIGGSSFVVADALPVFIEK